MAPSIGMDTKFLCDAIILDARVFCSQFNSFFENVQKILNPFFTPTGVFHRVSRILDKGLMGDKAFQNAVHIISQDAHLFSNIPKFGIFNPIEKGINHSEECGMNNAHNSYKRIQMLILDRVPNIPIGK